MNENCNNHEAYTTRAEAEAVCASLKRHARATGKGGRSYRRLHAYACGGHFHVGRSNSYAKLKPCPAKKIPSDGQLHRRLRNIEKRMDAERRHRAYVLGQMIQKQATEEAARDKQMLRDTLAIIYAPLRPEDV